MAFIIKFSRKNTATRRKLKEITQAVEQGEADIARMGDEFENATKNGRGFDDDGNGGGSGNGGGNSGGGNSGGGNGGNGFDSPSGSGFDNTPPRTPNSPQDSGFSPNSANFSENATQNSAQANADELIKGENFTTQNPNLNPAKSDLNVKMEFAPNVRDLAKLNDGEIMADLDFLAQKHPEMFEKPSEVFKLLREIKENPTHFYNNNRLDAALIVKRLENDKIGKMVVSKDTNKVIHATKVDDKDLKRLERVSKAQEQEASALSKLSSDKVANEPKEQLGLPNEKIIPQNAKQSQGQSKNYENALELAKENNLNDIDEFLRLFNAENQRHFKGIDNITATTNSGKEVKFIIEYDKKGKGTARLASDDEIQAKAKARQETAAKSEIIDTALKELENEPKYRTLQLAHKGLHEKAAELFNELTEKYALDYEKFGFDDILKYQDKDKLVKKYKEIDSEIKNINAKMQEMLDDRVKKYEMDGTPQSQGQAAQNELENLIKRENEMKAEAKDLFAKEQAFLEKFGEQENFENLPEYKAYLDILRKKEKLDNEYKELLGAKEKAIDKAWKENLGDLSQKSSDEIANDYFANDEIKEFVRLREVYKEVGGSFGSGKKYEINHNFKFKDEADYNNFVEWNKNSLKEKLDRIKANNLPKHIETQLLKDLLEAERKVAKYFSKPDYYQDSTFFTSPEYAKIASITDNVISNAGGIKYTIQDLNSFKKISENLPTNTPKEREFASKINDKIAELERLIDNFDSSNIEDIYYTKNDIKISINKMIKENEIMPFYAKMLKKLSEYQIDDYGEFLESNLLYYIKSKKYLKLSDDEILNKFRDYSASPNTKQEQINIVKDILSGKLTLNEMLKDVDFDTPAAILARNETPRPHTYDITREIANNRQSLFWEVAISDDDLIHEQFLREFREWQNYKADPNSKHYKTKFKEKEVKEDIKKRFLNSARWQIEDGNKIAPLKEFGYNYAECYRNGQGAVKKLLAESEQAAKDGVEFNGQVAGAFEKEIDGVLSDIDLVFGNDEFGLKHILTKHGDDFASFKGDTQGEKIANGISEIIAKGEVSKTHNGYNITYNGYKIGLNRGWNENGVKIGENKWIVTAFDKTKSLSEKQGSNSVSFTKGEALPQNSNDKIITQNSRQSQAQAKKPKTQAQIDSEVAKDYELFQGEIEASRGKINDLKAEIEKEKAELEDFTKNYDKKVAQANKDYKKALAKAKTSEEKAELDARLKNVLNNIKNRPIINAEIIAEKRLEIGKHIEIIKNAKAAQKDLTHANETLKDYESLMKRHKNEPSVANLKDLHAMFKKLDKLGDAVLDNRALSESIKDAYVATLRAIDDTKDFLKFKGENKATPSKVQEFKDFMQNARDRVDYIANFDKETMDRLFNDELLPSAKTSYERNFLARLKKQADELYDEPTPPKNPSDDGGNSAKTGENLGQNPQKSVNLNENSATNAENLSKTSEIPQEKSLFESFFDDDTSSKLGTTKEARREIDNNFEKAILDYEKAQREYNIANNFSSFETKQKVWDRVFKAASERDRTANALHKLQKEMYKDEYFTERYGLNDFNTMLFLNGYWRDKWLDSIALFKKNDELKAKIKAKFTSLGDESVKNDETAKTAIKNEIKALKREVYINEQKAKINAIQTDLAAKDIIRAEKNNQRLMVGKFDTAEAEKLGIDEPEFVVQSIYGDEIRHTLKNHGENSPSVLQSGQPAVTESDIAFYPSYVKDAQERLFDETDKGLPSRISFYQPNSNYFVVVEEVHNAQGELAFKTMFKGKGDYRNSKAYKDIKQKDTAANRRMRETKPRASSLSDAETNSNINSVKSQVDLSENSNIQKVADIETKIKELESKRNVWLKRLVEKGHNRVKAYDKLLRPFNNKINALKKQQHEHLKELLADDEVDFMTKGAFKDKFNELDEKFNPKPQEYKRDRREVYLDNERKKREAHAESVEKQAQNERDEITKKLDTCKQAIANLPTNTAKEQAFVRMLNNEVAKAEKSMANAPRHFEKLQTPKNAIAKINDNFIRMADEDLKPITESVERYIKDNNLDEYGTANFKIGLRNYILQTKYLKKSDDEILASWGWDKESLDKFKGFLAENSSKVAENPQKAFLHLDDKKSVIALNYQGKDRKWILTAYTKNDDTPRPAFPHKSEAHGDDFSTSSSAVSSSESITQNSVKSQGEPPKSENSTPKFAKETEKAVAFEVEFDYEIMISSLNKGVQTRKGLVWIPKSQLDENGNPAKWIWDKNLAAKQDELNPYPKNAPVEMDMRFSDDIKPFKKEFDKSKETIESREKYEQVKSGNYMDRVYQISNQQNKLYKRIEKTKDPVKKAELEKRMRELEIERLEKFGYVRGLDFSDEIEKLKKLNGENLAENSSKVAENPQKAQAVEKIQQKFHKDEKYANDLYEWHKDSSPLTKDEDGTPKVFYHGSSENFETFDKDKILRGGGFWFSPEKWKAENYSGKNKPYEVFLSIKKPLDLSQPINKNNYRELGEIFGENLERAVKENEKIAELENFIKNELNADEINIYYLGRGFEFKKDGKEKFVFKENFTPKIKAETDKLLRAGLFEKHYRRLQENDELYQVIRNKGYDGVKINEQEYVVFDSNQIKAVDNKGSWTDASGNITKDKPNTPSDKGGTANANSAQEPTHKYFNENSPNILMSKDWIGGGLAGGTLNSFETDEDGNVYFNPQGFLKGFVYGAAGTKAVKLALQKSPAIRKKAENFLSKSGEFLDEALKNPLMLPQEKARFAVVANKAMNAALDNRKFIIGGENAIGANRDKLARARVMQKQGKDEGEIWDKTGWYLDKDGKWKFEINAAGGALKVDSARDFSGKLNDFLADDELFKAYPMLKDFSVEVTEFNEYATKGFYDGKTTIYLQKADELVAKPTLYHEIQHAVQDFENFARGGTEKSALKALKRTENQHLANNVKDMAQKSNTTRGDIAYRNLHGEVEARNVEQRMQNIDELEMGWHEGDELAEQELMDLINSHPHKTMDRKLDDTIIAQDKRRLRGRNAAAYSVGDGKEFSADEVAKNLPKNLSKAEKRRLELFGNFVNKSIKDTNLNKSFNFGTISKANAERLRTIKDYRGVEKHFNLDGYTLKINADIIRHIQNRHPDDFNLLYNLYDIYHNFDKAQWNLTRNKKTGKPEFSISFFKTYKDGEVKAVEIDMINEKELSLKTLFRP